MKEKRKRAKLKGIPVEIVSDAEAEKVDFVVCMPLGPSKFTDNFVGVCSRCGIKIMYRWHAPRKPPKICIDCAAKMPGKNVTTNKPAIMK